MPEALIRNGRVEPIEQVEWLALADLPAHLGETGLSVLLQPTDDPVALASSLASLARIAVHFPKFTDGRGYSTAYLLRRRIGWKGELRAVGDIHRDQLFYLARSGFNAFLLTDGRDAHAAVAAFKDFSTPYQSAADEAVPVFRLRGQPVEPRMSAAARLPRVRSLLKEAVALHGPVALASSFGAEDMVLIDLVAKEFPGISVFTLDTGRLPAETLDLVERTREKYGIAVESFTPQPEAVAAYVSTHGLNGFYEGIERRKTCCHIRKVEPLVRALAGKGAWITGLRREQAASRAAVAEIAHDADHGIAKFNPLADWSAAEVWEYLRANDVPYNALHDRGYPSIGCEPCTRAVRPGEDPRAGRWWWELKSNQECGLHVAKETA
jgi:phosphoadenosine phosphosulfate reductase